MKRSLLIVAFAVFAFVSCSKVQDDNVLINTRWTGSSPILSSMALEFYDNGRVVCSIYSRYYEGLYEVDASNNKVIFDLSLQTGIIGIGTSLVSYAVEFLDGTAYMTEMPINIKVTTCWDDGREEEEILHPVFKKEMI